MKAVIVELKGHDAAALTDDGCILKIKNKKYAIGQVIELKAQAAWRSTKFITWAASAAAAVIILGVGAWSYFTPYSYVSLDVNPSIEYSVNRFDRVLSVTAVNQDGEKILQKLNLSNQSIDQAIKETVNEISQNGYFEGTDPGGIIISTSCQNQADAQQLAQNLQVAAKEETKDVTATVEVEAVSVGLDRVQQARTLGTTPGKLNLVQKLQASSQAPDDINLEEWLNKPVKEIMKAIKQNKKDAKTPDAGETDGQDDASSASSASSVSSQAASSAAERESASSAAQAKQTAAKQNGKTKTTSESASATSTASVSSMVTEKSKPSSSEPAESKVNGKSDVAAAKQSENGKQSTNNGNGKNK